MRLGYRRLGTSTSFVDASSDEVLFKIASDETGAVLVAFRIYDADGSLVAESDGLQRFPEGLTLNSQDGDLLLGIPCDSDSPIRYRLFNRDGRLLTCSDGARTQIFGFLRMEAGKSAPTLVRPTSGLVHRRVENPPLTAEAASS
jgi:hypothetical protein